MLKLQLVPKSRRLKSKRKPPLAKPGRLYKPLILALAYK
jgi:hypothetical protein